MFRNRFLSTGLFVLLLALPSSSLAAVEAYLKVSGVVGNSLRERWVGHIALHSYQLNMEAPGSTAGPSEFVAKTVPGGTTSVQLLNLLTSQSIIPTVTLNLVGTDMNGEEYVKLKVTMKDVRIVSSKIATSHMPTSTAYDTVEEHVFTLRFASAVWSKGS